MMNKDIEDRVEKIAKVEVCPGDMLMVFTDLSGMGAEQAEKVASNLRREIASVFPDEVKVVVAHKNVDIAVVSKTSSQGKSDAS